MKNKPTDSSNDATDTEQEILNRLAQLELETKALKEEIRKLKNDRTFVPTTEDRETGFRVGDRVRITNKGRYSFTEGTVFKITRDIVNFESDSGQKTSRKAKNLILVSRPQKP